MASPLRPDGGGAPPLSAVEVWRQRSAANVAAFFEQTARALDRRWAHWDDAWAVDLQCPNPILNGATLLRPPDPARVSDLIGRLSRFYAQQPGAPWVVWSAWSPFGMQSLGFEPLAVLPLMVRLPGTVLPAAPPELRVVEVADAATLADAERVAIDGYPLPELQPVRIGSLLGARGLGGHLRMWVGYLDDRAVATASALADEHINGIYVVATLPDVRGRGYGTALTAHAVASAPALSAVLQATEHGYALYARLGFTDVAPYTLWMKSR